MKEVRLAAWFPEQRYQQNGMPLTLQSYGTGSSLSVAIHRAFREMLKYPQIRRKSPLYIYLSVGVDGAPAIDFWNLFPKEEPKQRQRRPLPTRLLPPRD